MKKYIYFILIIIAVLIPFILNFLVGLNNPTSIPVVGNCETWINFWATYIAASIPFIILGYTLRNNNFQNQLNREANENQNKQNKELQITLLKYQVQLNWLEQLRRVLVSATDTLSFSINDKFIARSNSNANLGYNDIVSEAYQATNQIRTEFKVAFIGRDYDEEKSFMKSYNYFCGLFLNLLLDLEFFYSIGRVSSSEKLKLLVDKYKTQKYSQPEEPQRIWSIIESRDYMITNEDLAFYLNTLLLSYPFDDFEKACTKLLEFENQLADYILNGTEQNK